jgi:hypothetical protein
LSSDEVTVLASPYEDGSGPREAEARLRVGTDLDVGYGGFYSCTQ